ncbi:collagen-like protein [Aquimarina spinulae]|uniref:collagen-like protein n=1 Tax=Aquimarina spinulae TaxID=1192023 RepID=UPI000D55D1E2|nr:collagen-like protein [Aquimarina spinulae]
MKAITNLVKGMMIVMVSLLIFSCSDGEDGAIGPAGQDGVNGVDGTNGTDGSNGADGVDGEGGPPGTANVIYSDWIATDFETNVPAETNEQLLTSFNFGEFNLNEDVILVYGRHEVNILVSEIKQLPYILASQNEYYGFEVSSFSGGSSLRIEVTTLDGGTNLFTFFDDFRYVIIPGGISASSSTASGGLESGSKSARDYTKMSYQEIKTLFNIPE